jgi:hypothetical protein
MKFKSPVAPDLLLSPDPDRLAVLRAMRDPRREPEWQAWRQWLLDGEEAHVGTAADVRHLLSPPTERRHRQCLLLRAAWRGKQREYLRRRGWPVEWAQPEPAA